MREVGQAVFKDRQGGAGEGDGHQFFLKVDLILQAEQNAIPKKHTLSCP
jgi:hypothetical protein